MLFAASHLQVFQVPPTVRARVNSCPPQPRLGWRGRTSSPLLALARRVRPRSVFAVARRRRHSQSRVRASGSFGTRCAGAHPRCEERQTIWESKADVVLDLDARVLASTHNLGGSWSQRFEKKSPSFANSSLEKLRTACLATGLRVPLLPCPTIPSVMVSW